MRHIFFVVVDLSQQYKTSSRHKNLEPHRRIWLASQQQDLHGNWRMWSSEIRVLVCILWLTLYNCWQVYRQHRAHASSLRQCTFSSLIKHVVEVDMAAVQHLNPGQTPVLAMEVRWTSPDRYSEANFVTMLEELDIEMAVMKMHGDWLNGSIWTTIITRSEMASSGAADSFLKN